MDGKRRHQEWRVEVLRQGVLECIGGLLEEAGLGPTSICDGVFRVRAGPLGVFVCVAELCEDPKFLARDWASTQPTCYVTVDPAAAERFLDEEWLQRVGLAELLSGEADLTEVIENAAASGPPFVRAPCVRPRLQQGRAPRGLAPQEPRVSERLFVVEVGDGVIRVQRQRVAGAQAVTRYQVFRILWQQFVEDVGQGRSPGDFRAMDLETIIQTLQEQSGRQVVDEVSIRRAINRLQTEITETIRRRLGLPIQRDDVVETCRWKGQGGGGHGYRLNPHHVAVRPASS